MIASEEIAATLVDPNEATKESIRTLNKLLGSSSKDFCKIEDIVKQFSQTKDSLERKLELLSIAAPDKVTEALSRATSCLRDADTLQKETDALHVKLKTKQENINKLLGGVEEELNLVDYLERVKCYQTWVHSIQQISKELCSETNEVRLLECYEQLQNNHKLIDGQTACSHLQEYVSETRSYWHDRLLQSFSKELESILTGIHYPFVNTNTSATQSTPSPDLYQRLRSLTQHLLTLNESASSVDLKSPHECTQQETQLNDSIDNIAPANGLITDFAPLITPLNLLFKPLEVRFLFHFSGNKKTNSPSHPEWCLTRVLTWINAHSDFLESHIQPAISKSNYKHLDAKTEFSREFVKLILQKLSDDIPLLMEDEDLFCHCLQETLNFERELRLECGYPTTEPSVLRVLTQPHVFSHWIQLEKKFAVALMDELVSQPGAWDSQLCVIDQESAGDDGDVGVSACGENLVMLLQGITDRYKSLPQPGHRLQFLEVQLDVLDEFRVRAAQLAREGLQSPLTSKYPAILNTLRHVADTLDNWGDMPLFLELQMFQRRQRALEEATEAGQNFDGPEDETSVKGHVFENCVSLYSHMEEEMLETLKRHVMTEVRARSMPYRRDKWFLEPSSKRDSRKVTVEDISPTLCPLLETLILQLQTLRRVLSVALYTILWQALAKEIDKYLYEEVILQNHFSELGSAQLEYDLNKAIFPVFAEFSSKPASHFVIMKECLLLLRMPRPAAILLRDTLQMALYGTDARSSSSLTVNPAAALVEHGVTGLSLEQSFTVLNTRTNMASF